MLMGWVVVGVGGVVGVVGVVCTLMCDFFCFVRFSYAIACSNIWDFVF